MVESKRQLIERLNSALDCMESLPELIRREDIHTDDGFVDMDFFTSIIKFIQRNMAIYNDVMKVIQELFGIKEDDFNVSKKKNSQRRQWNVEEVLKNCTFNEGVLKLPDVQLNPTSYAEVKKWIEEAGGKWTGGKTQGFTFDFDAERVVGILMSGKRCNLQQEYQFFETPAELSDWLVSMAELKESDIILEPSAGRGALINAVHRVIPDVNVDYFELMPENQQYLSKMSNVTFCGEDFTKGVPRLYSKILANPPFSKNQDIDHVRKMFDALAQGGILCAITSRHWVSASERKCVEFRRWLEEVKAELHEVPGGMFRKSGTDVATMVIKIIR